MVQSSPVTTRIPGSPNSANLRLPVGSPYLRQYPPIASKEPQTDQICAGSARTCHVRIPLQGAFPQPRLSLQGSTSRSNGEGNTGQKKGNVSFGRDSNTSPWLALQDHRHPHCSP